MNKTVFIEKVKSGAKKVGKFLWDNRGAFIIVGSMGILIGSGVCDANVVGQTSLPWDKGINVVKDALTGPLPKAGAAIATATGGAMYMFGEGQATKTAMRVCLGSGVCLGAPSVITALTGSNVEGLLLM